MSRAMAMPLRREHRVRLYTAPRRTYFVRRMKILLAYGRGHIDVEFPDDRTTIIALSHKAGLAEERAAMPGFVWPEQWQGHIQSLIQRRAEIQIYTAMDDATVRGAHLVPCRDIAAAIRAKLGPNPNGARIAVLPQGPLTIPYLAS